MLIAPRPASLRRPQDPELVLVRLETTLDALQGLEQHLTDATRRGALVDERTARQVGAASTSLRFGAQAVRSLGSAFDAAVGEQLLVDADIVKELSRELLDAAARGAHFGAEHPEWVRALDQPINDVHAAIELVAAAPARP